MLEIAALIYLCSRMRNLLHERGRDRTAGMQVVVVVTWLVAQFAGAFVYLVIVAMRQGESAVGSPGIMTYVVALASAILGQVILFAVVRKAAGPPVATFVAPASPVPPAPPAEPSPFSAEIRPPATARPVGPAARPPRRHSRWGTASFALACLAGVSMFLLFATAGYMETTRPGGLDEDSPTTMLIGFFTIALMLLSLVALGLGITGLVVRDRRRVLAVLGTILAGLLLLGVSLVLIL